LLSAAGELDQEATRDRRHIARKAMIATLCFSGLRIDEMLSLRLARRRPRRRLADRGRVKDAHGQA
jgi:hypothetical protein